jgi:HK97 family phage prohead protease
MTERKIIAASCALKELTESGQFEGHAAAFNLDLQNDRIRRGAFAETIAESGGRWPVLFGHDTGRVVGFSTHAEEDSKGLYVRGEFTLTSDEGRNAYETVKHAQRLKQPFGLSIGYRIRENGAELDTRTGLRVLHDLDVLEFSLAAIPANPKARMTGVKADDWTIRDLEQYLRDGGLSKEAAIAIAAGGFKALDRRDADEGKSDEMREAHSLMSWVARESFLLKER